MQKLEEVMRAYLAGDICEDEAILLMLMLLEEKHVTEYEFIKAASNIANNLMLEVMPVQGHC